MPRPDSRLAAAADQYRAHARGNADLNGNVFFEDINLWYASSISIAIRRLVDNDKRSLSYVRLLQVIEDNPRVIARPWRPRGRLRRRVQRCVRRLSGGRPGPGRRDRTADAGHSLPGRPARGGELDGRGQRRGP